MLSGTFWSWSSRIKVLDTLLLTCDHLYPVVFSLVVSSSLKQFLGRHIEKWDHCFLMMWRLVLFWWLFVTLTISCFLDFFLSLYISVITIQSSNMVVLKVSHSSGDTIFHSHSTVCSILFPNMAIRKSDTWFLFLWLSALLHIINFPMVCLFSFRLLHKARKYHVSFQLVLRHQS